MFYLRSKTITLCLQLKNLRLLRRLRHRHCNRRCGCSAVRPPRELKHHEGAARIFNHLEAIRLDMQSSKPKASGSTRPKDAPRELSGAVRGATSHCRRRRAFETPAKSANPTSFRSCRELGRRFAISPHGTGGCGKIQARAETWERLLRRHLPRSLLHLFANSYIVSQPKRQYVASMHSPRMLPVQVCTSPRTKRLQSSW